MPKQESQKHNVFTFDFFFLNKLNNGAAVRRFDGDGYFCAAGYRTIYLADYGAIFIKDYVFMSDKFLTTNGRGWFSS